MITSANNARIKEIRKLRMLKYRKQVQLAFIEGIRIVTEAATHQPDAIETLVVAPELLTSEFAQEMVQRLQRDGVAVLEVMAEVFEGLSLKDSPQGIGAVIRQRICSLEEIQVSGQDFWVALDAIQDPGNLGTILRTCDAVGCKGVILLGASTDPYDPTALRGSMGAVFTQLLVRASFSEFASWTKKNHYAVVGTSGGAATGYRAVSYETPLVLLMGSERLGLSAEQQAFCDMLVKIPMVGQSDSLNVAVATGVVLYEIFYQTSQSEISPAITLLPRKNSS